jgi:hypothetical protein
MTAALSFGSGLSHAQESPPAPTETNDDEGENATELAELCRRLAAPELEQRQQALTDLLAAGPSLREAIGAHLQFHLTAAPLHVLQLLNEHAPDSTGRQLPRRPATPPHDLLPSLLEQTPGDEGRGLVIKETTTVVALLRALTQEPSYRGAQLLLTQVPRDRGVFRPEIARNILRLGDHALPVLLRARAHPEREIARFATRLLEWLDRTDPGRQVQLRNSAVLAELLRVYGDVAERAAIPVLLSFSGSEDTEVRDAARGALRRFGAAILWPTRTTYENFTGEPAQRRWGWQELARRLFQAQDDARLAQAERAMNQALEAQSRGDHEAMMEGFRQILARWPHYDRRPEMVPGIIAYAEAEAAADAPAAARHLLTQALMLAPQGPHAVRAKALLTLWTYRASLAHGVADAPPLADLAHAASVLPEAQDLHDTIVATLTPKPSILASPNYGIAGIALLGLALLAFFILRLVGGKRSES